MDPSTLLQRQAEVCGILRRQPKTADELSEVVRCMRELVTFVDAIESLSRTLKVPTELTFQFLMQKGAGATQNFDKQARKGAVPMHQAKVLNRVVALDSNHMDDRVLEAWGAEEIDLRVSQCQILRDTLRMKVEDGNDLEMARQTVAMATDYFTSLSTLTGNNATMMFRLHSVEDEASLRALLAGCSAGEHAARTGPSEEFLPPPLPRDAVAAVRKVAGELTTKTGPVPARLQALQTLQAWLKDAHLAPSLASVWDALREGMKAQLSEQRSAVCRAACEAVMALCSRSDRQVFQSQPVRDTSSAWMDVLLKQVPVTVAAISQACDCAMRSVVVHSQGAPFVCSACCHALARAKQVELRCALLEYLCLAVVCAPRTEPDLTWVPRVVSSNVVANDEGVRRAARALGLLFANITGCSCDTLWDEKVQKVASGEQAQVLASAEGGWATFEKSFLRRAEPTCPQITPSAAPAPPCSTAVVVLRNKPQPNKENLSDLTEKGAASRKKPVNQRLPKLLDDAVPNGAAATSKEKSPPMIVPDRVRSNSGDRYVASPSVLPLSLRSASRSPDLCLPQPSPLSADPAALCESLKRHRSASSLRRYSNGQAQ